MDIGFPTNEYTFPEGEGSFMGKLVMKKWTDNKALLCYFDTQDSRKLKIQVYWKPELSKSYRPRNSSLDVSQIPIGTVVRVEYGLSKNGKTIWLTAEII